MNPSTLWLAAPLAATLLACSSSSSPNSNPDAGGTVSQTPPMGESALKSWLATGDYKKWKCEPALHAARSPSPHGFDRVCSNDVIAANSTSKSAWPEGAAAVKELYAKETDKTPTGYAVYLKTAADSNDGANWYWYEQPPGMGAVADGLGSSGGAKTICVSCHTAAGSNAAHTPTPNGHDFVYTPL